MTNHIPDDLLNIIWKYKHMLEFSNCLDRIKEDNCLFIKRQNRQSKSYKTYYYVDKFQLVQKIQNENPYHTSCSYT